VIAMRGFGHEAALGFGTQAFCGHQAADASAAHAEAAVLCACGRNNRYVILREFGTCR
jgi:hypothetical protein